MASDRDAERRAATERVLEAAARLERELTEAPAPSARLGGAGRLRVVREDGTVVDVARDRWVIGRGAHCDLVIESPRISREHAALVKGADGSWSIEDLGSSNGTWCRGERVTRRRIEPGDEFYLCSERIRCELG